MIGWTSAVCVEKEYTDQGSHSFSDIKFHDVLFQVIFIKLKVNIKAPNNIIAI
mgnify:CR=1 FL=1